jgi:hypothetical protein
MKKIMVFIYVTGLIVLAFFVFKFVSSRSKYSDFKKKRYYAMCSNNQGMVTNEIYLYNDSSFYTEVLGDHYYGRFETIGDTISFITDDLTKIGVSNKYQIVGGELIPLYNGGSGNRMLYVKGLDGAIK